MGAGDRSTRISGGALLGATLLALPLASAAAPAYFTVTPASGKYSYAVGLNNEGRFAVNNTDSNVPYRIGYISGPQQNESVGTLGGDESIILGLNNRGEAVGVSTTADRSLHAFRYSGGRLQDLTTAYGIANARAINDRGDIAGTTADSRALVRVGARVDVFGPATSEVSDINNGGDVVGNYYSERQGFRAFRYSLDEFADLGTLGGGDRVMARDCILLSPALGEGPGGQARP